MDLIVKEAPKMKEIEEEIQEVPEIDPLSAPTASIVPKIDCPVHSKMIKITKKCAKSLETTDESDLMEQLNSFLTFIRRDLGSNGNGPTQVHEMSMPPKDKSEETKVQLPDLEQKLSFESLIHRNLSAEVAQQSESTKTDHKPPVPDDSTIEDFKVEIALEKVVDRNKRIKTKITVPLIDDYTCRYCQHVFATKKQRQYHEKNVHPKTNVLCDICGQISNIRRYHTHMKRHIDIRNFECAICSKRFKGQYDLKRHLTDVHENRSDFICDICDKRLRSKKSMRKHMIQFHMSQYALQCPECSRPFGDRSRLTRHLKVHKRARGEYIEVIKKAECHICQKMFENSTHLKQHMGKHSGVRQFRCSVCPAAFNFHSSMRNHEKKVHEGKARPGRRKSTKKGKKVGDNDNKNVKTEENIDVQVLEEPQETGQEELKLEFFDGPITIVTNDAQVVYQIPYNFTFQSQ